MKNSKIIFPFLGVLVIAIAAGVFYFIQTKDKDTVEEVKYTQIDFLPNLNQETFEAKRNSGEEFSLLVWRSDCGDSQDFIDEFLSFFAEYNADGSLARLRYNLEDGDFYSLDISEFIGEIGDKTYRNQFRDLYGFYFTPSLVYYQDTDDNGVSEIVDISEWDPINGFRTADYFKWFYDHQLVVPNESVYHEGQTDKQD